MDLRDKMEDVARRRNDMPGDDRRALEARIRDAANRQHTLSGQPSHPQSSCPPSGTTVFFAANNPNQRVDPADFQARRVAAAPWEVTRTNNVSEDGGGYYDVSVNPRNTNVPGNDDAYYDVSVKPPASTMA